MRKLRDNLTKVSVWLLVALSLLTALPLTALGQEKTPAKSGPSAAAQTEMKDPAADQDAAPEKRRILSKLGPQTLTPEQEEEAGSSMIVICSAFLRGPPAAFESRGSRVFGSSSFPWSPAACRALAKKLFTHSCCILSGHLPPATCLTTHGNL